jgi:hypothetical protein
MSDGILCQTCGIGYHLPSGRCDHCDTPRARPVVIDTADLRHNAMHAYTGPENRKLLRAAADEIDRLRAQLASLQPDEAFDVTTEARCYAPWWQVDRKYWQPRVAVSPARSHTVCTQHHVLDCWPEPSITLVKRPARKLDGDSVELQRRLGDE